MKAGLILRVVWVVGGRTGDAAGPQALKADGDARVRPPTLYGQYVRVPEGVALPHVLPVQGLGAAPSAVPRGGVARDHVQWPKTVRATALTTSHGRTLAGAPALRVAFVITTAPLALAAALTMTLLAAQVVVNSARSSGDAACSGVNLLHLAVSPAGKGGEGMRRGTL